MSERSKLAADSVLIKCPCGRRVRVKATLIGKRVRCTCGQILLVDGETPAPQPAISSSKNLRSTISKVTFCGVLAIAVCGLIWDAIRPRHPQRVTPPVSVAAPPVNASAREDNPAPVADSLNTATDNLPPPSNEAPQLTAGEALSEVHDFIDQGDGPRAVQALKAHLGDPDAPEKAEAERLLAQFGGVTSLDAAAEILRGLSDDELESFRQSGTLEDPRVSDPGIQACRDKALLAALPGVLEVRDASREKSPSVPQTVITHQEGNNLHVLTPALSPADGLFLTLSFMVLDRSDPEWSSVGGLGCIALLENPETSLFQHHDLRADMVVSLAADEASFALGPATLTDNGFRKTLLFRTIDGFELLDFLKSTPPHALELNGVLHELPEWAVQLIRELTHKTTEALIAEAAEETTISTKSVRRSAAQIDSVRYFQVEKIQLSMSLEELLAQFPEVRTAEKGMFSGLQSPQFVKLQSGGFAFVKFDHQHEKITSITAIYPPRVLDRQGGAQEFMNQVLAKFGPPDGPSIEMTEGEVTTSVWNWTYPALPRRLNLIKLTDRRGVSTYKLILNRLSDSKVP